MGLARVEAREAVRERGSRGEGKGKGEVDETEKTLGGPVVHFWVHVFVGGLMGASGLGVL